MAILLLPHSKSAAEATISHPKNELHEALQ